MAGNLTQHPVLRINRHPILIDNETQVALDLQPGESLYQFLYRHIDNLDGQPLVVSVGSEVVERHLWHDIRPKDGANIEVRFTVQRSALMIVALVALSMFTAGAAAGIAGAAGGFGTGFGAMLAGSMGTLAATAAVGAIQVVGAMLINKVLGPKVGGSARAERDTAYGFNNARNQVRQYEPLGLLFGVCRVTPDVVSLPYTYYQNNDQYMGMILSPGINVARFDPLTIGDTPISNYEGARVLTSGFSGMDEQEIPLYSNVDTLPGGALDANYGVPGPWVTRTGPADTMMIQIDLSYLLFDLTSKGKEKDNRETVMSEYRAVGSTNWMPLGTYPQISRKQSEQRRSYRHSVPRGQYEVRVRRMGYHTNGSGATCEFNLASMTFIQADDASYDGIARIGVELKATGQLNGAPDTVRGIMYAETMPYWTGTEWVGATVANGGLSNPGAQALQYARGIYSQGGNLIAGMGLDDTMIDIDSFKAFMVHCATNSFTYNHWATDTRNHDDVMSNILRAGMGRYSWSPGRLTAIWVAAGQPHKGVVTMANIKSGEFQIDYSLSQGADGIEYTYVDAETWETKTLRVPAPGVTVMENPARLTGEGVTSEAHAAILARYHMAQNLYQFKDIVFGQTLEHMAYGELSVIRLSHDLTQWGFSGRLAAASNEGGVITLELDEDVPAASGNAPYVGLRIPGEGNYRVFPVTRLGERLLRLDAAWPVGVPFPGASAANPTHDTIWLYDFKSTPGLRCRVIGISPSDDLAGASVSVVPESDEFWAYVLTGEYIPPQNESLLRPQPSVHDLRVREEWVVQGNTVFSRLHANWSVEGVASEYVVSFADAEGIFEEVARTSSQTASWRVDRPGNYAVMVRPYDEKGVPGIAHTVPVTVYGADRPPVNVDEFAVIEQAGGVRLYTWDFLPDTIQSPDMAGVEIRFVPDHVTNPIWESMSPLGDTGFYTAPFEAVMPAAGNWTFAIRTINTNGILAADPLVIRVTLTRNLGEQLGVIGGRIDQTIQQMVDQQMALDAEIFNRVQGDLNTATQAGLDATAKANAARDAAMAYADGLNAGISDLLQADEWNDVDVYPAGDFVQHSGKLYRSLIDGNANIEPGTDPLAWELLGNYASVGQAVAASISMSTQNASNIAAESVRVDAVAARMPVGSGKVATEASVTAEATARTNADTALASRTSVIEARMPTGTDKLANEARVINAENAAASANSATADRVGAVEARMPAGNGALATQASVTAVEDASVTRDNANASAIQSVQSAMGSAVLGYNLSFEEGNGTGKLNWYTNTGLTTEGMMADSGFYNASTAHGSLAVRLNPTTSVNRAWYNGMQFPVVPGERIYVQMDSRTAGSPPAIGTDLRIGLRVWLADGTATNTYAPSYSATVSESWMWGDKILSGWLTMPANAVKANLLIYNAGQTEGSIIIDDIRIERESLSDAANASGISGLTTRVSNAEGQIAAQATSIDQVTATANSTSASITQLSEVVAQSNAVVVVDGSFEGSGGWSNGSISTIDTPSPNMSPTAVYQTNLNHVRSGKRSLRFAYATSAVSAFNHSWIRVQAGQKLRITFWAKRYSSMAATDYVRISGRLHKQDGTSPYTYMGGALAGTVLTTSFQKSTFVYTVPVDVWCIQLAVQCQNATNTAAYAYVDDVSVEIIGEELESARAKHTVALDVNGNVSGTVNENDGTRSSFSILATVFRVLSSVTGMGMEWQDGYLRMWKGSAQIVMGHTFGPGNLLFWAGPNVGASNVTKANGTWWLDTSGNSYFAGQVLQGILRSFNSTTSTSSTASVSVTASRLGKTVAVAARFQYQYSQTYNGFSSVITLGGGSTGATIVIDRRYGTGAWSELTRVAIGGFDMVVNETDGPSSITQGISGQAFVTDAASTSDTEYRARLVAISRRPHTVTNPGNTPAQVVSQYLSIEGIE